MEIKVKTMFSYHKQEPYMAYNIQEDKYFLVVNPIKNMRNIKQLMKKVKSRIKQEIKIIKGVNPIIYFQISSFKNM